MTDIIAIDLGGTHARFARATLVNNRVTSLGDPVVLQCAQFAGFEAAWNAYAAHEGRALPRGAALAVASPVHDGAFRLTNLDWVIDRAALQRDLRLDQLAIINDMAAVGHAIARLDAAHFEHICGPATSPEHARTISVVGPGTGVGVTLVSRRRDTYAILPNEGGHAGFAPATALDDAVMALGRARHGRVSAERVLAGSGLALIREAMAEQTGRNASPMDDKAVWAAALDHDDALARAALTHYCSTLGRFAGDVALMHGADAVVLAGGLGLRLAKILADGAFATGFTDKGRFAAHLQCLPVHLVTHPQPGLLGAAAAFAQDFPT